MPADRETVRRVRRLRPVAELAEDLPRALRHHLGGLAEAHPVEEPRSGQKQGDREEQGGARARDRPGDTRREALVSARGRDHLGRRHFSRGQRRREGIAARQRESDLRGGGGPLQGFFLQAPQHHALDRRVHVPKDGRGCGRRFLSVLLAVTGDRHGLDRAPARVQLVEDEAERIEVAPDRGALAGELFGRHVSRRPRKVLGRGGLAGHRGQPEVRDARAAPAVEHDVGGLQVPVEDAAVVRRRQPGADLPRHVERLVRRKTSDALEQRGEVLAVDVLHREEVLAVDLGDVVHPAHVGVRDLARGADLGEESVEALPVRRERARQELQRDGLAELQVVGAVHLAHAAAADQSDDAVALGEDRPGGEAAAFEHVGGREPPDQGARRLALSGRVDGGSGQTGWQLRGVRQILAAPRAGGSGLLDLG